MKPLQKTLNVETIQYYRTHVALVNVLSGSNLTDREIDLLAFFVQNGGINSESRNQAEETLGFSQSNISNYLRTLKEKGVVIKKGKYMIAASFYPSPDKQHYTIILNENKNLPDSIETENRRSRIVEGTGSRNNQENPPRD